MFFFFPRPILSAAIPQPRTLAKRVAITADEIEDEGAGMVNN